MRTRGLVAGCALAGGAALAAFGAARAKSDPAELKTIEPAAHAVASDVAGGAGWLSEAASAVRRQADAERTAVQSAAAPLADRVVAAIVKPGAPPAPPTAAGSEPPTPQRPRYVVTPMDRHQFLRQVLTDAAQQQGLDPGLVMAVSWWESGWDMSKVSDTGAIGLMQIDPGTARDLGPTLLHRKIDVHNVYDNADLGAAVLKANLQDSGGNIAVALASYYEGGGNVDPSNLDANAQTYVAGVLALQRQFDAGLDPAASPTP